MMKRDNLIKICLLLVMVAGLVYAGIYFYERGVADCNQQAKGALGKALERELEKRGAKSGPVKIQRWGDISKAKEMPPVVWMEGENGRVEYKMSVEKHYNNITEDKDLRILHSMVLEKEPIVPDTLNVVWQQTLKELHLVGSTALCISTSRGEEHTTTLTSADYTRLTVVSPLFSRYLGYGSEVQILGFFDSSWWCILKQYVGIPILLLFAICIVVYASICYLMKKLRHASAIKEVIVTQIVKELPAEADRIYQLVENCSFNADRKLLIADGKEIELRIQACTLLEAFLTAQNQELSYDALMKLLWPDGSGTVSRLQQAVTRLRQLLKVIPSIYIVVASVDSYKLSIKEDTAQST